jgi:hypothetical protein
LIPQQLFLANLEIPQANLPLKVMGGVLEITPAGHTFIQEVAVVPVVSAVPDQVLLVVLLVLV